MQRKIPSDKGVLITVNNTVNAGVCQVIAERVRNKSQKKFHKGFPLERGNQLDSTEAYR